MTNVRIYFMGKEKMVERTIDSGELQRYLKMGCDIGNLTVLMPNGNFSSLQINTAKGKNRRKVIPPNYIFKDVKTVEGAIDYHRIRTGNELVVYVTERTDRIAEKNKVLIE